MTADWARIPYRDYGRDESGADCWGLVRIIRQQLRGDMLDCLTHVKPDDPGIKHVAYLSLVSGGFEESEPVDGAIVFSFSGSLCAHAGIVATVDGRQCVVDTTSRTGVRITPLQRYRNVHRIAIYDNQHLPVATQGAAAGAPLL